MADISDQDFNFIQGKRQCFDDSHNCHAIYPYSDSFLLYGINPTSDKAYTDEEIRNISDKFESKCKIKTGEETAFCCDPDNLIYQQVSKDGNLMNNLNEYNNKNRDKNNRDLTLNDLCRLNYPNKTVLTDFLASERSYDEEKNENELSNCKTTMCPEAFYIVQDPFVDATHTYDDSKLVQIIHEDDIGTFMKMFNKDSNKSRFLKKKLKTGYPGNTCLIEAIAFNSNKIYMFIIKNNPSDNNEMVNEENIDGNTALHLAALLGNSSLCHLLIKIGANVTLKNKQLEDTPLICASRSGDFATVSVILYEGGDVDYKNKVGDTALHAAVMARYKHLKIIHELVKYGADLKSLNNNQLSVCQLLAKFPKTKENEEIRTFLQNELIKQMKNEVNGDEEQFMLNYRNWIRDHQDDAFFEIISPKTNEKIAFNSRSTKEPKTRECDGETCNVIDYLQHVKVPDPSVDSSIPDDQLYINPVQNNIKDMKEIYEDVLKIEHDPSNHSHDEFSDKEHFGNQIETFGDFNKKFKHRRSNASILIYIISIIFIILLVFMVSLKYN